MAKEHAGKIVSLMSEYCLCQRVKPCGDPKSPFKSDDEYIAALQVRDTTISRLLEILRGPPHCDAEGREVQAVARIQEEIQ